MFLRDVMGASDSTARQGDTPLSWCCKCKDCTLCLPCLLPPTRHRPIAKYKTLGDSGHNSSVAPSGSNCILNDREKGQHLAMNSWLTEAYGARSLHMALKPTEIS